MHFRILGSLEASADEAIAELGSPKQRALLAMLLLHSGEVVSVDRLIDALWTKDPPRTAAHSIQIYVSELRKALTPLALRDVIITRRPGYQLRVDADDIDSRRFERLVDNGVRQLRSGDRAGGTIVLREALELWGGPVLSDFAYDEFALPHIRRLNDRHLDAIEELADAELADGRVAEALSLAEAAMREYPLRERAREIAMLSLYRSGRHAEALRTYQRLRQHLVVELGLDPSPSVQRLQERILLHDPTLLPVAQDSPHSDAELENPYKGLRPFAEDDAEDFFGRDALVGQLIDALRNGQRLVALVGPSGSSKSSAVAAGLLPRLRSGTYIEGSDRWDIRRLAPGRARALELELVAACAVASAGTAAPHTLLVIDPFEDLFVDTDDLARRRVLRTLSAIGGDRIGHVSVVLTLRADYYDRPLLDPDFAAVFIPAVINALPMTTEELETAIVGPAAKLGIAVEASSSRSSWLMRPPSPARFPCSSTRSPSSSIATVDRCSRWPTTAHLGGYVACSLVGPTVCIRNSTTNSEWYYRSFSVSCAPDRERSTRAAGFRCRNSTAWTSIRLHCPACSTHSGSIAFCRSIATT